MALLWPHSLHLLMNIRQWALILLFALVVFGIDQGVKLLIDATMYPGESVPKQGFFRLTFVRNTGAAFGLFRDRGMLLTVTSIVGIAVMVWYFRRHTMPGMLPLLSLGMLLGGALGNLADRVRLGSVVDFIDVGPWPIFNLADAAVVTGVAVLLWLLYQPGQKEPKAEPGGWAKMVGRGNTFRDGP